MRLEYHVDLSKIEIPRFSVETDDRTGKLFTLATLVFNVLDEKPAVEIVFHGLNARDPARKIATFREITASVVTAPALSFEEGEQGHLEGSSLYFCWLTVRRR